MFREKEFLIEKGLYPGCREDTCYIIGTIYDEVVETGIINVKKIEELREYLDKNREIVNNKDYSISLTSSIIKRFKESFNIDFKIEGEIPVQDKAKSKKVKTNVNTKEDIEYCNIYNVKDLLENNSIRKVYTDWENKTGVYGIFVNNNLVYIGSTSISFKDRFLEHKGYIRNNSEIMYLYKKLKLDLENNCNVEFKPLIILEDLQMLHKKTINKKELKCMEFALIMVLQPKYNIAGRLQPFNFS